MQETQEMRVRSLIWEDPLEEEMSTLSSILAWEIPWTEEPGGLYSPWCCKGLDMTEVTNTHTGQHRTVNQGGSSKISTRCFR